MLEDGPVVDTETAEYARAESLGRYRLYEMLKGS
jgi:hypothetical protein